MNNFQNADAIVSKVNSEDYWSEYQIEQVRKLIDNFDDNDWDALENSLKVKEPAWRAYFAEALSANLGERSYKILLSLLGTGDYWTTVRAIESLSDFDDHFAPTDIFSLSTYNIAKSSIENSKAHDVTKKDLLQRLDLIFKV